MRKCHSIQQDYSTFGTSTAKRELANEKSIRHEENEGGGVAQDEVPAKKYPKNNHSEWSARLVVGIVKCIMRTK